MQFVEAVLEQDRAKDRSAREEEKAALDAYQQASAHLVSKPQILYPIEYHYLRVGMCPHACGSLSLYLQWEQYVRSQATHMF